MLFKRRIDSPFFRGLGFVRKMVGVAGAELLRNALKRSFF